MHLTSSPPLHFIQATSSVSLLAPAQLPHLLTGLLTLSLPPCLGPSPVCSLTSPCQQRKLLLPLVILEPLDASSRTLLRCHVLRAASSKRPAQADEALLCSLSSQLLLSFIMALLPVWVLAQAGASQGLGFQNHPMAGTPGLSRLTSANYP